MALRLIIPPEQAQELASREALILARHHWREATPAGVAKACRSPTSTGFSPSTTQAKQVASLIALGLTPKQVSATLLIELPLLKFFYERELEVGAAMVNAKVASVALKMALSENHPAITMFWLKTRAGFKETTVVEATLEVTDASEARRKLLGTNSTLEGTFTSVPDVPASEVLQ